MPQRYLASANRMPKKEGGARSPSFWTAYIPGPCLPVCSPRKHRGAMGCTPSAWEVLSRPCPLDTSRTPYRTSGLPAGAEPSFESKDIIASTNPNQLDAYENYRAAGLHAYRYTGLFAYAVSFLASIEPTSLRSYTTTCLQDYTATGLHACAHSLSSN